jgi:hypothetical protein
MIPNPVDSFSSLRAERNNPGSQMTHWIARKLDLASLDLLNARIRKRIRARSAPRDDDGNKPIGFAMTSDRMDLRRENSG